jgi:hypothetical protein
MHCRLQTIIHEPAEPTLVTCICVCHDKPDLAHEAIQSIVSQSYPNWEALVVDSGVLFDAGYFDAFAWRNDPRVKLLRSEETEEIRATKAMAPWCFNECFRKGLVSGDLVMYLCDDDILYPNAFDTFVAFSRRNPHAKAMYASQDLGVIYPTGWRAIVGQRRATQLGGKSCNGRPMDCQVDYLQFCHKTEVLKWFPDQEYWPESKETQSHADGIFMERVGKHVVIHPIDVTVSQNRRTPQSTFDPVRSCTMNRGMAMDVPFQSPSLPPNRLLVPERVALRGALADLQDRLHQLTAQNQAYQLRLDALRYRVADRLHALCMRVPFCRQIIKGLLSLLA